MNKTIIIPQRFCGPPGMANGGYISGLVAQFIDGPAAVTLYLPSPLEQVLTVEQASTGKVVLKNKAEVIAEAMPASLDMDLPEPPTFAEAQTASQHYLSFKQHPFPNCFVCGPDRAEMDGLRIFPGPIPGRQLVAAPWTPDPSLVDNRGLVKSEFLWAALDCPGGIAAVIGQPRPILLGQLTATIKNRLQPGTRSVVMGWPIAREGRKHIVGTALFSETGDLSGYARAVWIEPKNGDSPDKN